MKKVAIDIDGCVANTSKIIQSVLDERNVRAKFTQYHPIIEGVEDTNSYMDSIVTDLFSNRMHEIEPYSDAKYELGNIHKFVGPITFVTARREDFNKNTLEWLSRHFPNVPFQMVNRSSKDKTQYLVENSFDFFIEDRLKTANEAASKGIRTYLINRGWNMNRDTHPDITRISLFGTFFSLVVSKEL
jgi:uncharacterized HAD superfamily protein